MLKVECIMYWSINRKSANWLNQRLLHSYIIRVIIFHRTCHSNTNLKLACPQENTAASALHQSAKLSVNKWTSSHNYMLHTSTMSCFNLILIVNLPWFITMINPSLQPTNTDYPNQVSTVFAWNNVLTWNVLSWWWNYHGPLLFVVYKYIIA